MPEQARTGEASPGTLELKRLRGNENPCRISTPFQPRAGPRGLAKLEKWRKIPWELGLNPWELRRGSVLGTSQLPRQAPPGGTQQFRFLGKGEKSPWEQGQLSLGSRETPWQPSQDLGSGDLGLGGHTRSLWVAPGDKGLLTFLRCVGQHQADVEGRGGRGAAAERRP